MEMAFLYSIPHTSYLDGVFLLVTKIAGSYGQLWVILGVLLLLFKKTRKIGVAVLISYLGVFVFGQLILKHLVERPRPCQIDQTFELLIERPTSSSFPSTHSAWAFGAATAVFLHNKKAGIITIIVASVIAFSRLYMFMHFPTDVLAGIVLGVVIGILVVRVQSIVVQKIEC